MDDFREWLSDNLRYILLGLAVLLLLIIAFFAIKLVHGIGSPKTGEPETQAQAVTETVTEAAKDDSENKLVKEAADSELQQLVEQYYTAVAAQDYDTLQSISESFTDEDKKKVENASAIESYNNIAVYSKKGLTDGSYIVYAYCDAKITGIETMAPRLEELYVLTNADGKLVFGDTDSSQELQDYVLKMQTDADVQALVKDVNGLLDTAMEKDADLASYVEAQKNSQNSDSTATTTGSGDTGEGTTDGGTTDGDTTVMQATTGVNVRAEASEDATINGSLYAGMQVEVLENLDNGWSHIRYTADGTTIEGYAMTQYLEAVQN